MWLTLHTLCTTVCAEKGLVKTLLIVVGRKLHGKVLFFVDNTFLAKMKGKVCKFVTALVVLQMVGAAHVLVPRIWYLCTLGAIYW